MPEGQAPEAPSRSRGAHSPAAPSLRGLGGGSGPALLTWPPAAAGSPATWQPWAVTALTRRPSGLRSSEPERRGSPGAAALRRRPLPWCGQGSASPSDPAPQPAAATPLPPAPPACATAHFRWGERESVTRAGPGGCRAHAPSAPSPSREPPRADPWAT